MIAVRSRGIKRELGFHINKVRRIETEAITRYLDQRGMKPAIAPGRMATVISGICHTLEMRRAVGVTDGHREVEQLLESWLASYLSRGTLSA